MYPISRLQTFFGEFSTRLSSLRTILTAFREISPTYASPAGNLKMVIIQHIKEYCQQAAIHGPQHIVSERLSRLERLVSY